MTREELLRPRYKVIADYPKSLFFIGDVVNAGGNRKDLIYCDENGPRMSQYPHLFREMHWSENRKPDDIPEYVGYMDGKELVIGKLLEFEISEKEDPRQVKCLVKGFYEWRNPFISDIIPSSKQEYEEQNHK